MLSQILAQADVACGIEKPRPEAYDMWSSTLLSKWAHLSLESFILAIREGLMSGKVYGKLNLPQIGEWLTAIDQRISDLAESEAAAHKYSGDNLGADYNDRQEWNAGRDARKLERANAKIMELERRLSVRDETPKQAS